MVQLIGYVEPYVSELKEILMKNRFTIQVRGVVDFETQEALQASMQEVLKSFPEFKLTFSSIEVWQDPDGNPRLYDENGKEYFPILEDTELDSGVNNESI